VLALTIRQPYAALVAAGLKRAEYRTWRTPYRGWLAVHAAASQAADFPRIPADGGLAIADGLRGGRAVPTPARGLALLDALDGERVVPMPFAAIVALARLVDVVPVDHAFRRGREARDQLYAPAPRIERGTPAPFAWRLADAWPLPAPVPIAGKLGLWKLPADVAAPLERLQAVAEAAAAAAAAPVAEAQAAARQTLTRQA
jgi:hypothetical protein